VHPKVIYILRTSKIYIILCKSYLTAKDASQRCRALVYCTQRRKQHVHASGPTAF